MQEFFFRSARTHFLMSLDCQDSCHCGLDQLEQGQASVELEWQLSIAHYLGVHI